ncbi:macro domain-containing protein [Vibrio europaeus]|uniref:type II toxin-antitoxin system antitoxin DNA ADP-ribosyl glycohydrolase DarG n=1 Tax=Vibrio europaeus TaxID=300876 RepID=UPI0039E03D9D
MITYVKGDLLTDNAEAIVNAVNTVGVMGKGLAYQFKEKYPENFSKYREACKQEKLSVGKVFTVSLDSASESTPKYIVNFPTKAHWRGKSKIEYIEDGLTDLISTVRTLGIKSVALPALGSGLGGLPWSQVEKQFLEKLSPIEEIEWRIYAPTDGPRQQDVLALTPGRSTLLLSIDCYLKASRKKQISVSEVHCLVYLLQQKGLLQQILFKEYREFPFSVVLNDSLKKMDGHCLYLSGLNRPPTSTYITLDSTYLRQAKAMIQNDRRLIHSISGVIDMVSGYQSNEGMSIISTVMWSSKNEATQPRESHETLLKSSWDLLSKQKGVSEPLIKGALNRLIEENWLSEK